jgi:hypothetical protein
VKTAVVILNWNGRKLLEEFLPSVVHHSLSAQVIIADNASTDDSVDFVKKNYPGIKVVSNKANGGYAGGYNEALKNIDAEYYILLNSDVEVTANWIEPVIALMDKDESIAVCQPKIKSYAQRNYFEYAGAAGGFIDKHGFPYCRGRIFNTIEEDKGQYDDEREIFWASGACMFIRSKIFHELGAFDGSFFAHMEEIDLCWRIHRAGFKVFYCAESTIYHLGGGTLDKNDPRKTYLNFRNNLIMIYKNAPDDKLNSIWRVRTFLDRLAAIKFFFSGYPRAFVAVLKAHWYCYKHKDELKKKREDMKALIKGNYFVPYRFSIVFQYFLKGKKRFSQLLE